MSERDQLWEHFIESRIGDNTPCTRCRGDGVRAYGSTATWRGGIGGLAITGDVCDRCWGSGIEGKPWPSHRERQYLEAELKQAREERDRLLRTVTNTPLVPKDDYATLDTITEGLAAALEKACSWLERLARLYDPMNRETAHNEIAKFRAALTAWQEHKGAGSGR